PGGTEGSGLCSSGTQTCSEGGWGSCLGETLPGTESCDGLDNDCDGSIDEDFNQNTDILNCGSCGNSCFSSAPANTNATGCSVGVCQYSCKLNYYDRNGNILSDGCEEFCELTNGGVERCDDGIDNDCDGVVDEFDGDNDINNCGSCGYSCSSNAPDYMDVTGCSGGVCQYVCASNYHDLDGSSSNGCEYYCSPSNGGTESCDGTDNDCDGNIDEGFDTNTDLNNCGSCGYSCSANAPDYMQVTGCSGGVCQYSCQSGYLNIDGLQSNGCEYSCTVSSGGVESCDGLDNDCDGQTDEDGAGLPLTQSCYTGPGGTQGVGICSSGTQTCGSGSWGSCLGETLPVSESCDGVDNDCDSATDEDFDQNTDILNCGGCGNSCFSSAPANTNATGCSAGACQYVCVSGYHDVNGDINNAMGDGCEYACDQAAPDGTEYCNGVDDDCDSLEDEASDLVSPPSGYCKTEGGCGAVVNSYCELFEGDKQWVCDYPAQVERMPGSPNEVAYYESLCDGYDNDCNGQVDEDFLPIKGDPCSDGDYGLCEGTGTVVCKVDLLGTECNITSKQSPQTEVCDGVDNDCDGKTDEGPWDAGSNPSYVEDEKETIIVNGYDVDIYKYEASRSTATLSSAGIGNTRSCSRVGVKPWNRVTYLQAQRACAKAGMRLCTADEWYTGCEGGSGYLYPYGNTYDGLDCNGDDYGVDDVINTGDANQCYNSTSLTWDMSGNLKEWTSEYRGQSELNKRLYTVRGGSFYDHGTGLTCDFTSSVYVENVFTDNVGFRCCTTCGNGTVEAGEQCDDGNQINGDGCDYLCASEAGQTCGNGVVEGSEECDDGNRIAGDGCSAACFDEPEPICGNGVIEADEDCDDGNTILNDGCEYCQITPICGDSTVETPEQCDDGNANDGDGCDSDCQWEPVHCGGQMDSYGYEMCTGTLGFSDIRGTGTKLGNADDEVYSFSISFNFNLYGSNYNSIDVNTNGNINFQSNSSWSNNALPSSTYTMVLSPLWDDLNSSNHATQGVWAQNFGSFPNRYTVIQWYTEHYSDSGEVMFEVILHENGDIDFIYNDVDFSNATYDDGADATVGIQGSSTAADGYYLQYSYNSASLSNGMSITFHHP
nr:MopE-related protein [Deltaproteobacteria bacterium]